VSGGVDCNRITAADTDNTHHFRIMDNVMVLASRSAEKLSGSLKKDRAAMVRLSSRSAGRNTDREGHDLAPHTNAKWMRGSTTGSDANFRGSFSPKHLMGFQAITSQVMKERRQQQEEVTHRPPHVLHELAGRLSIATQNPIFHVIQ
jgi:hypothetical protein